MEFVHDWLPILTSLAVMIISLITLSRASHRDTGTSANERATMQADIRYIRSAIDDIKLENKGLAKDLRDIDKRLTVVEQSVKSAHHRLDTFTDDNK